MDLAQALCAQIVHASSVELLPQYLLPQEATHHGWAFVDGHLGISHKELTKAYVALCRAGTEAQTPETSLLALLATTEHITVVNSRKRLCIAGVLRPRSELHILDVILSSHLYKHTKSPTLWSHRRWLLETQAPRTTLEHEWAVVSAAAVRHPCNYYAWAYMRWYCTYTDVWGGSELVKLRDLCGALCTQHLSDVSMWAFLHWLGVPELAKLARATSDAMPGHEAILAGAGNAPRSLQFS